MDYVKRLKEFGDLITRFSGIVITGIMTGVIWVGQPDSFMDVILYDNFHVLLWVGGMYFALRGNRT
jgi:putative oxidoreductase